MPIYFHCLSLTVLSIHISAGFSIVFGLFGVFYHDHEAMKNGGFFQGYNKVTWMVVSLQVREALSVITYKGLSVYEQLYSTSRSSLSINAMRA